MAVPGMVVPGTAVPVSEDKFFEKQVEKSKGFLTNFWIFCFYLEFFRRIWYGFEYIMKKLCIERK